jgi:dTDP-4-dehydrorhamnose 3,5-epimerase
MVIKKLKFEGVYEIQLEPISDERGFFMRTCDRNIMKSHGMHLDWVQENHSKTHQKGTVRGLHFQFPPYSEAKLIRCIRGAILNVFVDLRKNSNTFGEWGAVELNPENNKMVYLPEGFANGFCILKDESEILYKSSNSYHPESEGRILWNDPDLNINWPVENPILSDKDVSNMLMATFVSKHKYLDT